jgi:hypoxanthine phosphoribosyltransferase
MTDASGNNLDVVISEAALRERVAALGLQISSDYQDRGVHCVGVLENCFIFLADLVREIQCEVRCQFIKPYPREIVDRIVDGNVTTTEIFYAPEVEVAGRHILLCDGILSSGQTTDFLVRNFQARGAASVAVCGLLDRTSARRVHLSVAYSGFEVGPEWFAGYGLGSPGLDRNLPYIFAAPALRD